MFQILVSSMHVKYLIKNLYQLEIIILIKPTQNPLAKQKEAITGAIASYSKHLFFLNAVNNVNRADRAPNSSQRKVTIKEPGRRGIKKEITYIFIDGDVKDDHLNGALDAREEAQC